MRFVVSLLRTGLGSARELAPVVGVVAFFQVAVLRQPFPNLAEMLVGLVLILVGLTLFVRGLEMGLFPLGESMAWDFARKGHLGWLLAFAFALGFGTTVAEPALIAVSREAAAAAALSGVIVGGGEAAANYATALRATVALSVGCAVGFGVLRIVKGWPLHWLIIGGYGLVAGLTELAPPEIIGIAYDSGGVTTSTITVPLVTALGIGLSSSIRGRRPMVVGFGLIAFAWLATILLVLVYWILTQLRRW